VSTGIVVVVRPDDVESTSDVLWSLGTQAIEERWLSVGVVELWTELGEDRRAIEIALRSLPADRVWRFVDVDESVADEWRRHARPHRVSPGLVIVPEWFDQNGVEPWSVGTKVVRIEPGPTFGLGDHPTTSGCLASIESHVRPGDTVLDVGCGSGVLGIAALVSGASRAHGTDLMPAAVRVSTDNATRNGVADRWSVSTEPLEVVGRPFDVVVANILLPVLVELTPELVRLAGRILIVSGVLDGTEGRLTEALAPLVEVDRVTVAGWTTVVLSDPRQVPSSASISTRVGNDGTAP